MADPGFKPSETVKREMARSSNDEILVHNPTPNDFTVVWDSTQRWVVPARNKDTGYGNGNRVVPRYVAKNYIKHMIDKLINEASEKRLEPFREKALKRGDHWPDRERKLALKTSDTTLRGKYLEKIAPKLVKQYGMDETAEEKEEVTKDDRTFEEKALENIESVDSSFLEAVSEDTTAN